MRLRSLILEPAQHTISPRARGRGSNDVQESIITMDLVSGRQQGGWRARWVTGGVILGLALLFGLLEATQVFLGRDEDRALTWFQALDRTMPSWLILAAVTPGILLLARRFRFERDHVKRDVAVHITASVIFALVHLVGTALVPSILWPGYPVPFASQLRGLFSIYFVLDVLTYWTIAGTFLVVYYYREFRSRELTASRLQASLADARLQALRGQLNPHFLFNTLNAISVMALKGERDNVVQTLSRLSDLLRFALDETLAQEVPLEKELEFMDGYLDIQRIRFADRLSVRKEIADDVRDAMVPSMIMQPLVENAVQHGIANRPGPGEIRIRAFRENGMLRLEVRDTGPGFGMVPTGPRREGIGLANTRARLEQLYGSGHKLEYAASTGGGAAVAIAIPLHQQSRPPAAAVMSEVALP